MGGDFKGNVFAMLPSAKPTWLKVSRTSIFECTKSLKRNVKFYGYTFPANISASLERGMMTLQRCSVKFQHITDFCDKMSVMQCRVNHCPCCTMGGGPRRQGVSTNCQFFTTLFWHLNVEKTFTSHKFRIGLLILYLHHCVWSVITGHISLQTACLYELRTSAQQTP